MIDAANLIKRILVVAVTGFSGSKFAIVMAGYEN
jgi:hypothetical protein